MSEAQKRKWMIYSREGRGRFHYWNTEWGWVFREAATKFTDGQKAKNLHIFGDRKWVKA